MPQFRTKSLKTLLIIVLPLLVILLGFLFIYYNYLLLTNTIKGQTAQINNLIGKNNELTRNLAEAQRELNIYKNDLADISFPEGHENLIPQVTGFSSSYIDESTVVGSEDIQYKDQHALFINTNLTNLGIPGNDYPVIFAEFIYDEKPYFTLYEDQSLSNEHAAKIVPVVFKSSDYVFTAKQGFKVYKTFSTEVIEYMFVITPTIDNKPRLVEFGYFTGSVTSPQYEKTVNQKIVDIINSIKID